MRRETRIYWSLASEYDIEVIVEPRTDSRLDSESLEGTIVEFRLGEYTKEDDYEVQ